MSIHIENREKIVEFLRSELMGPSTAKGEELDCSGELRFSEWKEGRKIWVQKESREEIIQKENPVNRYGIGVLYPMQTDHTDTGVSEADEHIEDSDSDDKADFKAPDMKVYGRRENEISDSDDFDLSLTNTMQPASMGISFLVELPSSSELRISLTGGRYAPRKVQIENSSRTWYLRSPVSIPDIIFSSQNLLSSSAPEPYKKQFENGLAVSVECYSRPDIYSPPEKRANRRLLTICVVNRTKHERSISSARELSSFSLFQTSFSVGPDGGAIILPYPEAHSEKALKPESDLSSDDEKERASFRLLYHRKKTYAIGHGCAACWDDKTPDNPVELRADPLPEYELPSITPDVTRKDKSSLKMPMAVLAGLKPGRDALLADFIAEYEGWIEDKKSATSAIESNLQGTAGRHLDKARICANRMKDGVEFLREDPMALEAFQLANKAILLQQQAEEQLKQSSEDRKRTFSFDSKLQKKNFEPAYSDVDISNIPDDQGNWRAFQIAFILTSLRSAVDDCDDRELVELIWFPTGGGKTEAYLGLAAFTMFYRRLQDNYDNGVNVLMRYTLRLLTTQQFQRASRLICAMEKIRRETDSLGEKPFSIGIWVGAANTPNSRQEAKKAFSKLKKSSKSTNPFVLRQCPWCGAEMGSKYIEGKSYVLGYKSKGNTVVFACPDIKCLFHNELPVHVIDEDIYQARPSLIIGTVDKFAMLAWAPKAGALFGLDQDGKRELPPPGLIIQDELHLISGPLGTMVGLYETVIEELCTDRRGDSPFKPKIVCSTATIRRYQDQIRNLFARKHAFLFPPPGIDEGDSFFARYATDEDGTLSRGRQYIGLYAPGLPSMQTLQVRVYSTILLSSLLFDSNEERDPWWTLLIFFNSIRELGGALSLFQTDILGALKGLFERHSVAERRYLNRVLELTSRMSNEEIPKALDELSREYTGKRTRAIDVCLASSIIEVGIDIDRLSLMSIVGQPKTIAQYIQVSGRVGRKWWERPGLVTTMFSSSKPRDRSHFEKFQSSHSQLYAQVEPTSVTPFSPPVIDRALHAIFAIYLRLFGDRHIAQSPKDVDPVIFDELRKLVSERVAIVDSLEIDYVMDMFKKRLRQFRRWDKTWWDNYKEQPDSLLRRYGAWVTNSMKRTSWPTPTSMRNVDAECQMDITTMYNVDDGEVD